MTGQINVLIVEDEFVVAIDIQAHLEQLGYSVCGRVNSGEAALRHVREVHTDIVLMDVVLKGDMSGIEAASMISSQYHIPVVYITANTGTSIINQAKETEPSGFIVKPFTERELRIAIELALYKHRMETQLRESEHQLQLMNVELEQRVQSRTRDLQEANRALKESLDTLKQTQEQLVQSEKMAALGRLVASVSHEVKNPVGTGLLAASHLAHISREMIEKFQNGTMTRPELEHYLNAASESSDIIMTNLSHAIDQFESLNQVAVDQESQRRRRFFLKPYFQEVLLSLRPQLKKTRHHLTITCPDDLELESYPGFYAQIIRNLVVNTLKHAFAPGEQGKITIDVCEQNETVSIHYHDTGKGMTEDVLSKIFEPFYTTKRDRGNTGLGLHIVYNLVTQQLHGTIGCKSLSGGGTSFFIEVPREFASTPSD